MKSTKINKWHFVLLAITLITACKPKKTLVAPRQFDLVALDSLDSNSRAQFLLGPHIKDWTYFSAKIDFEFTQDNNNTKSNAHVRMYKDSIVWISAGMGLIRIMINNDSMVILDKLNNNYRVYDKKALDTLLEVPLQVGQLQNLLMGQPAYALKLYQLSFLPDSSIQIRYKQDKFVTRHMIQRSALTIDSTRIDATANSNYANALYTSYSVIDEYNFPHKISFFSTGNKPIHLDISYSDPDFTTVLTFPFAIPSNYEKVK